MDTINARIAGYEYGLRHPQPMTDYDLDTQLLLWWQGSAPVPDAIERAWYQGLRDSGQPDEMNYCTPEAAASTKGVDVRTIYRILRDDERRAKHFPRAIAAGEGTRRTWRIHIDDLVAWQPSKAGRKRLEQR